MKIFLIALFFTFFAFGQISSTTLPSIQFKPVTTMTNTNPFCSKLNIPKGCTCIDGNSNPNVTCQCLDIFRAESKLNKILISYDQNNQCVINYFPGCQPKILNNIDSDLCLKFKRAKNILSDGLKTKITCDQIVDICPENFKLRCHETPDFLEVTCLNEVVYKFTFSVVN